MEYVLEQADRYFARDKASTLQSITSDSEAVRLCQQGNRQAYGYLVKTYMQRAYYCALGIVGSHEAALDISQDAFVRAFRAISRFEPEKQFFTWYYKILRNLCLNFVRNRKAHARSFSEINEYEIGRLSDDEQNIDENLERKELRAQVRTALNSLKPQEREIIMLKDFQDYSYKEIADILDIPIGTVMSRLYNARKALKAKLERIYP
jgi:RNA polymerase sigma-70 factor (ECF subfamily)